MRIIGLISGTSYDGIEAAAADLRLDDETLVLRPLGALSVPYDDDVHAAIARALPPATTTVEELCRLDTACGHAFAGAAQRALDELCGGEADLVASHGQTLFHWVADGAVRGTLQVGQPAWIAEATGLPVVADLRSRDVAAGGQGAPLVSVLDVLLLRGRPGVPAALNLGGIANVTVLPPADEPVAFDTGPANALIDAAVRHFTDGRKDFDAGGGMAARGRVVPDLLEALLAEPYYAAPPPKSTGKELFHLPHLLAALDGRDLPPEDVVATVTELTARTVADALRPFAVTELLAAGGGTRNPVLMARLAAALPDARLSTTADLGLPPGAKEAYAFALLGFLTAHRLPGTVAACTGARHAAILGAITPGARPLRPALPTTTPARLIVQASDRA